MNFVDVKAFRSVRTVDQVSLCSCQFIFVPGTVLYCCRKETVCEDQCRVYRSSPIVPVVWNSWILLVRCAIGKKSIQNRGKHKFCRVAKCFRPDSNWRSFACQANGLTNFPTKALLLPSYKYKESKVYIPFNIGACAAGPAGRAGSSLMTQ